MLHKVKDIYALGPNIRYDAIRKTRTSGDYFAADRLAGREKQVEVETV